MWPGQACTIYYSLRGRFPPEGPDACARLRFFFMSASISIGRLQTRLHDDNTITDQIDTFDMSPSTPATNVYRAVWNVNNVIRRCYEPLTFSANGNQRIFPDMSSHLSPFSAIQSAISSRSLSVTAVPMPPTCLRRLPDDGDTRGSASGVSSTSISYASPSSSSSSSSSCADASMIFAMTGNVLAFPAHDAAL